MRFLVLVLACVCLFACGGGGGGSSPDPLTFEGTWSGTWNLSPSENGTVTGMVIAEANGSPGYVIQGHTLTNTNNPPDSTLSCGFDLAGNVPNQAGTYQRGSDPTFSVTGGQLILLIDGQTITGTVEIAGSQSIQFNLTRQP